MRDFLTGTALFVIDIQNDYFPGGQYPLSGSIDASLQAQKVLKFFRSRALPVIHVEHEAIAPDATFFLPNTDGQKIHANALPADGEFVIKKHYISSFEQTPLLAYLQGQNIRRMIITGMQTNVCVLGATTDGLKHGFEVIVLRDATAAVNPTIYAETIEKFATIGATVMSVDDFLNAHN